MTYDLSYKRWSNSPCIPLRDLADHVSPLKEIANSLRHFELDDLLLSFTSSTIKKREGLVCIDSKMTYPIQYGLVQRALLLTSGMTIGELISEELHPVSPTFCSSHPVMSQLDLSEETQIFYRAIRGVTMCIVL